MHVVHVLERLLVSPVKNVPEPTPQLGATKLWRQELTSSATNTHMIPKLKPSKRQMLWKPAKDSRTPPSNATCRMF